MASWYLDEGNAEDLGARLRTLGHDATTTREAGNKGLSDTRQLVVARSVDHLLATCNGRDFAALHGTLVTWANLWGVARETAHPGILIVPNGNEIRVDQLATILDEHVDRYPVLRGRCFAFRRRDGWNELFPAVQST
jgi:hypothetical protein